MEPHQPSLFKASKPCVAVLSLANGKARSHQFTFGLDAVCEELSVNVTKTVTPETIDECDIAMCSFCSPQDVLAFISRVHHRPRSRLIIGGHGAYPFVAWRRLCHRVVFGRAEQAADRCVLDSHPLPWAYDYDHDRDISETYEIRQAVQLLKGEVSVGCNGRCKFCQYRAVRRLLGSGYAAAGRGARVVEDRFEHLQIRSGRQTTALDGWSEKTRSLVGKPIGDAYIVEQLERLLAAPLDGVAVIKVFQIVGYPWESLESVREDVLRFRTLLGRVRSGCRGNRVVLMFTVTPFSPEPMTEMEDEPANITADWRGLLLADNLRCVFNSPHLNAFILPQIPGPLTLYRRVAVNRLNDLDALRGVASAETLDQAVASGGDICARDAGYRVSRHLRVSGKS